MRDVAPQVFRQRLLMEGIYDIDPDAAMVEQYLLGLAGHLSLRVYGRPLVHTPSGQGNPANQGFDAFVPLIDSGISAYVWSSSRLLSVVVYSCKAFEARAALDYTREFWRIQGETAHMEF